MAQVRAEERVRVPTDRLDLSVAEVVPLDSIRAVDSGRIVGPKAANLGQLAAMFPDRVSRAVVVPFGVFRRHMSQPMLDTGGSYSDYLQETFVRADTALRAGTDVAAVDEATLKRLAVLQAAIRTMPLLPGFIDDLRAKFLRTFGVPFGQFPVFVRSDTNMEDLKEFTGAGLNLTVPNVRSADKLVQSIRDVWASPYAERSYRWRQRFLLNPEHVYPSILLQESINAEKSGVLITTGIFSAAPNDLTVAFSRGVGGAVSGQSSESFLLREDGRDLLLAPAREPASTVLPTDGGVLRSSVAFERPILTVDDRAQIRGIARDMRARLPGTPGIESAGPYDVELGFLDGKLWLFQVRPFVENKRAQSSVYLRALDKPVSDRPAVLLTEAVH